MSKILKANEMAYIGKFVDTMMGHLFNGSVNTLENQPSKCTTMDPRLIMHENMRNRQPGGGAHTIESQCKVPHSPK